ncbi:GGDEF domain-containing protein [Pseudenterobacter timonensis]|uniref:diguanylate cyclase n=1 Tax=Pseudenterobacter timonensis TaxID=1755099 RepID=A0AAE4DK48_9ENTR|nr:GGDEF domain-containing protein [Pseudenterobacter timonensis]MDR9889245.1 GGDEF domain-containing protein [Pseudenterobacter timonensis]
MTAQSWRALRHKKYQFSLRLFLLLNAFSALFSIFSPLYYVSALTFPVVAILLVSVALLLWHWKFETHKINIPLTSLLFGSLWAWHIVIKTRMVTFDPFTWLLLAFVSVIFIGALAFATHIKAFTLHSLPAFLVCIGLSSHEHWPRIFYSFALPLAAIAIHQVIQKRNDRFAQQLLYQLLEERETLTDLSMIDPLTGVYNRRGLQNRIENLPASEHHEHFILLLDIDHFKAYNDRYGHMMGDQALTRVSAAIRDTVRSRDIVARFGGEEFLVLLTSLTLDQARQTAERIRQQILDLKIPHCLNESTFTTITVSIGMGIFDTENTESAIEKADKALYEAKHRGRNNILLSRELQAI